MKRTIKFLAILPIVCIALSACGGKGEGSPMEVMSKKAYQQVDKKYKTIYDFHDGLACVVCDVDGNSLSGFIDKKGKEVIPCKYDYAGSFSEGIAIVQKDLKKGAINKKGKIIIPLEYYDISKCEDGVMVAEKDMAAYGAFNAKGENIIPFEYKFLGSVFDGMILAKNSEYMYGYFDTKGKLVVDFIYDGAYPFSEGLAIVEDGDDEICIDTKGKEVFRLPSRYYFEGNFNDGLALVYDKTNDLYGYVNKKGDMAISWVV